MKETSIYYNKIVDISSELTESRSYILRENRNQLHQGENIQRHKKLGRSYGETTSNISNILGYHKMSTSYPPADGEG